NSERLEPMSPLLLRAQHRVAYQLENVRDLHFGEHPGLFSTVANGLKLGQRLTYRSSAREMSPEAADNSASPAYDISAPSASPSRIWMSCARLNFSRAAS